MSKMLRSIIPLIVFALLGAAFAQTPIQLDFFHKWPEPENMEFWEWAVSQYEAENPNVDIVMEAVADEPYKDKIRVLMASGDVPDIYFSWSGEFSWKFARGGQALDLTEEFYDTNWSDYVINAAAKPFEWQDRLYGIPINIDAKFMAYNTEIFDELGLSVPQTSEEFLALCAPLREAGYVPLAFGNEFPWAASHYLGEFNAKLVPNEIRSADYLLESEPDELFTHPGYVEALAYFQDLMTEGCFNEGPNATSHSLARATFAAGRAAMVYIEVVEFTTIIDSPMGAEGWDFFRFPNFPNGAEDQDFLTGAPDGFMVSSQSEHPEEAVAFLKWLTSPEIGSRYTEVVGMPSASIGAVNEETSPEMLIRGVDAINEANNLALWLDTDIDIEIVEVYLPGSQAILLGNITPEALMEQVQAAARSAQLSR